MTDTEMLDAVEWAAGGGDTYDYMPSGFCPFCNAPAIRSVGRWEAPLEGVHFAPCALAERLNKPQQEANGEERSFYDLDA